MSGALRRRVWKGQQGRKGIGTTAAAAVLVIVIIAAVVGYLALSSAPAKTSTSSSLTSSRTQPSTTSTSPSNSTSVSSSSTGSTSSVASFPFSFSLNNVSQVLVSPGGFTDVVYLTIGHATQSNGEAIVLNSTNPAGIDITFSPSSLVLLPANGSAGVTLEISAASNVTLGNDTVEIHGVSEPFSQSASFTLRVVQYLVFMSHATVGTPSMFLPPVLNVTAGSTVYWQNLDGNYANCGENASTSTGLHSVVFTTIPGANSSTIEQFQVYSYTFTTPGSYFYYSSLDPDHSMSGIVNVMAADGAGIGDVAMIPAFSYFKGGAAAVHFVAPPKVTPEPEGMARALAAAVDSAKGLLGLGGRSQLFFAVPVGGALGVTLGLAIFGAVLLAILMSTPIRAKVSSSPSLTSRLASSIEDED